MSNLDRVKAASRMAGNGPLWGRADVVKRREGLARAHQLNELGVVDPTVPAAIDAELEEGVQSRLVPTVGSRLTLLWTASTELECSCSQMSS